MAAIARPTRVVAAPAHSNAVVEIAAAETESQTLIATAGRAQATAKLATTDAVIVAIATVAEVPEPVNSVTTVQDRGDRDGRGPNGTATIAMAAVQIGMAATAIGISAVAMTHAAITNGGAILGKARTATVVITVIGRANGATVTGSTWPEISVATGGIVAI